MGLHLTTEEIMAEVQRAFPREFQIAMLTVTTRKQDDRIQQLEAVVPSDSPFWDKSTEKRVPLRAEKDKG